MNITPSKKFVPFLIVQFVLFLAVVFFVGFLMPGAWAVNRSVGLAIMLIGAVFLFTARFQLGNSFSATAQARELVTHGLYSKIRNPIYVFSGLIVLGMLIVIGKPYPFLFLLFLITLQTIRARKEARVLEAKFGDQYREYRKRTWF